MKRLIKKILKEDAFPRGAFNVTGTYKDVKPYYNFISQGPTPGRERGPGFNFKSKGPEGVNYFMEEDGGEVNPWAVCTSSLGLEGKKKKDYSTKEKNKYEKCVMSVKGKLKENRINHLVGKILKEEEVLNEKHWCGGDDGGWCTDSQYCQCHGSNCACKDMNKPATGIATSLNKGKLNKKLSKESTINRLVNKILKEEENECTNCYCDHSNCSVGDSCLANLGGNLYSGTMTNCAAGQPGCAQGANNQWVMCVAYGVNPGNTSTGNIAMLSDKGSGFVNKQGGSDRLTKFNRRQIGESKHGGSYMAKKQLFSIADKAMDMADRLPDNTQLEDWMESHIAKADSMMDSVYDSFDYDNQMDIPGFEGTMDDLNNLSIREELCPMCGNYTCTC